MNKRIVSKLKIITGVIAILLIANGITIGVSSYLNSRDMEWQIQMSVSDVSPTGLKLTIERDLSERTEELIVGSDYWIQKRTLFGWKNLDGGQGMITTALAIPIKEGERVDTRVDWEQGYGRLWPGVYRICKLSSTQDCYSYSEEERVELNLEQKLCATFLVLF